MNNRIDLNYPGTPSWGYRVPESDHDDIIYARDFEFGLWWKRDPDDSHWIRCKPPESQKDSDA